MNLKKMEPFVFDTELDFFPLYGGKIKPSSMGLKKLREYESEQKEENKTFLFGPSFAEFRQNKEECRNERLSKYYQSTSDKYPEIIEYIVKTLSFENRDFFSIEELDSLTILNCHLTNESLYFNSNWDLVNFKSNLTTPFVDAVDALSMQVSEDIVIHKVPNGQLNPLKSEKEKRDYASHIHLVHCNGWDAEWAINNTFDFVHKSVPRISSIIPNSSRMMLSFLNQGFRFERIAAISFKTTPYLTRHHSDINQWGKEFNKEEPYLTSRVERQTVRGFKESEAYLFTIKTYLYHIGPNEKTEDKERADKRLKDACSVFENPDEKSYSFNVIKNLLSLGILDYLKGIR